MCGRFALLLLVLSVPAAGQNVLVHPSALRFEFVAPQVQLPSVHASTLVETPEGVIAAWFGGSREGAEDVVIYLSRLVDFEWSAPLVVATGEQPDGTRYPCWNPVLTPWPDGSLRLFYKVGPAPARWWGMYKSSRDNGRTWSAPVRLPDGILGPIKNKPAILPGGKILSGSSIESTDSNPRWTVHFELSADTGRTWTVVVPPPPVSGVRMDAIQPTLLVHPDGPVQALGRTRSGNIFETWSPDGGMHWTPLALTKFPNPNAGVDAVRLKDGRFFLVYNGSRTARTPLNVAISPDGHAWKELMELEVGAGEYSYPAVIQTRDGLIHITYTWNRTRIMYAVLDPARLDPAP